MCPVVFITMEGKKMRKVIILSGVPGTGKTSFASKNYPGAVVCSSSSFLKAPGASTAALEEAHAKCLRMFVRLLIENVELVVVDNTNSTTLEIAPYAQFALAESYQLEIITLKRNPEVAAEESSRGVKLKNIMATAERIANRTLPPWWPHREIEVDPIH